MGSRGWAGHCSECDQTSFRFGLCRICLRYTFVLRGTDEEYGKACNQKWPHLFHCCSLMRPPAVAFSKIRGQVRFGSWASPRYARDARGTSAMPPIATELVLRNEPSLSADFVAKVVDGSRAE